MESERKKPVKPYADFPLTPHNSGKWAKKIKGHLYYFGRWEDPDGALREYNSVKEALHAGRKPTIGRSKDLNVKELFNKFLDRQVSRVDSDRLDARTFMDAKKHLQHFGKIVGPARMVSDLGVSDYKAARSDYGTGKGPHAISRYVSNVKTAFNFGKKNGFITHDMVYGDEFSKESVKVHRRSTRERSYTTGAKLFSVFEVREMLAHADGQILAMIYLGLNAGFLAADLSALPMDALDLDDGWMEFPRTKTEVMRAAPLWPETVKAIQDALMSRPEPKNAADAGIVFITKYGNRWLHKKVHRTDGTISKVSSMDAVNHAFRRVLDAAGIRRKGINFSALRTTVATIANEVGDTNAALLMRVHSFPGMDAFYVKSVVRERLEKVANHVRSKLLCPKPEPKKKSHKPK